MRIHAIPPRRALSAIVAVTALLASAGCPPRGGSAPATEPERDPTLGSDVGPGGEPPPAAEPAPAGVPAAQTGPGECPTTAPPSGAGCSKVGVTCRYGGRDASAAELSDGAFACSCGTDAKWSCAGAPAAAPP